MSEFLHMGGYASYVWSAFGLTFVVVMGNFVLTWRGLGKTRTRIRNRNNAGQGE